MNVLGISAAFSHDAAACLVVDGLLVGFVEEERLCRIKRAPRRIPVGAIAYCLAEAGLDIRDVDSIATGWSTAGSNFPDVLREWDERARYEILRSFGHCPPMVPVAHHLAHAAASYHTSGFEQAVVLVMDGQGETASTSSFIGSGGSLELVEEWSALHSLGIFFHELTRFVAFETGQDGKTMGLAPYGAPRPNPIEDVVRIVPDGYEVALPGVDDASDADDVSAAWRHFFAGAFPAVDRRNIRFNPATGRVSRGDGIVPGLAGIARLGQEILDKVVCHLVQRAVDRTGIRNIVLAGGVSLNCTANGLVRSRCSIDDLHIFPAANDAGTAVGAALHVAGARQPWRQPVFLGPSFRPGDILEAVRLTGLPWAEPADPIAAIVDRLERSEVVAHFDGRMEAGPRALGNRSVLALPDSIELRDRVNDTKRRERWRPLAPAVLAEDMSIFEDASPSPFMIEARRVRAEAREAIPGAVHVDGSARPQTVLPGSGTRLSGILAELRTRTGGGVLLNTSFNDEREPLVCSPIEALRTFAVSGLDAMAIGPFIVGRPGSSG